MRDQMPGLIKHVVVLMLENRGFDHVMGWLYGAHEQPNIVTAVGDNTPFRGLSTLNAQQLAALANPLPRGGGTLQPREGARSPKSPAYNTGENFEHIMNQMWGVAQSADVWHDPTQRAVLLATLSQNGTVAPPMTGYLLDYDAEVYHHTHTRVDAATLGEVLDTYVPAQLPVLSGLARYYAVSDAWYCSVPSQTNTNRAFSMAGTSRGLVNNSFYDPLASTLNPGLIFLKSQSGGISNADALPVSTRSVFEVMQEAGFSWKVFWQDTWPPRDFSLGVSYQYVRTMLPLLADKGFDDNFVRFDATRADNPLFTALRNGNLPALSWIEPKWGGGTAWDTIKRAVGNDMHPVSDTTVAEDFVMDLYNALTASPAWPDTLLVITFDENGGTYDHVPPPAARPSGVDAVPLSVPKKGDADMDPATRSQFGFDFAQYGVRVPTLLISPRVPRGTVFRSTTGVPYDHTSLIASVLTLAQIDRRHWQLGNRVAVAPTFDALLHNPQRPIATPSEALSAPDPQRPVGETLACNVPYVLEYVGDPWFARPGPRYLGASSGMGKTGLYYPTLTADPAQAVRFTLAPAGDSDPSVTSPLLNMTRVNLRTTERSWTGLTLLCVDTMAPWVYFARDNNDKGTQWQVRLLSSRDPREPLRTGDLVYFVSQLPPGPAESTSARITPDPLQRLLPHPKDTNNLTTRAGEWALWRLRHAIGDDNV